MKLLRERGPGAIAKALPLLGDDNPDVRLAAAAFAYKIDPPRCLEVLRDLMKTPNMIGMLAYSSLWIEDPAACPDPDVLWGDSVPEALLKRWAATGVD